MKTYHVTFARKFEVDVQAESIELAKALANRVMAEFPADSCKLLSIYADDYVEPIVSNEPKLMDAATIRNEALAKKVDALLPKEPA